MDRYGPPRRRRGQFSLRVYVFFLHAAGIVLIFIGSEVLTRLRAPQQTLPEPWSSCSDDVEYFPPSAEFYCSIERARAARASQDGSITAAASNWHLPPGVPHRDAPLVRL